MIPHHVSLSINRSHGGDGRTRVQMVPPKCPLLLVSHVSNLMNHPNAANLGVSDPVFSPPISLGGISGQKSLHSAACDEAVSLLSGRGKVRGVERERARREEGCLCGNGPNLG